MFFWIRAASDKRNFWIERLHHAFVASDFFHLLAHRAGQAPSRVCGEREQKCVVVHVFLG